MMYDSPMAVFFRVFFIIFIIFQATVFAAGINYTVEFRGLNDSAALKSIKSLSQLTTLKKQHPPASINALRYRAESDIPEILKVLHAHGYYEATVDVRVEEVLGDVKALVIINPGPVYKIEEYSINLYCDSPEFPVACDRATLKDIGIVLGKPALGQKILKAELTLLEILGECGYPLAEIAKREVIADGETKGIRIRLDVQTGHFSRFGTTTIRGLTEVKERYILQKITWCEGAIYDSRLVESTQKILMDSGLFSSVLITHGKELDNDGLLPVTIDVAESKHKSISAGASYQTVFGPGVTFGWENRDIGGMGRRLSLQGDITKISHSGTATLLLPDFRRLNQDLVFQAIAMRESIFAYVERSYSLTGRLDRKITQRLRISGGTRLERMLVTDSVANGDFSLLEVPFYVRWSTANSLLNATKGMTVEYRITPSMNVTNPFGFYLFQEITHDSYYSFTKDDWFVLAQQVSFGTIASTSLSVVPIPRRFLGGSEQELRGYRYRTVSPLIDNKPEGGRSAIYYTLETRFRVSQSIGLVPFFDIGNVWTSILPSISGKWLKSVGLGLRYFSFIGPLRLDVAFPLDRRHGIDSRYRFLVSIGQTF